jgi:hypothetical protein
MNIYSNLIKFFEHSGNYILIKLIMNIHEYSKILDYFFDTLESMLSKMYEYYTTDLVLNSGHWIAEENPGKCKTTPPRRC